MRSDRRRAAPLLALIVLATGLAGCVDEVDDEPVAHGELEGLEHFQQSIAAPSFTVETIDGDTISLANHSGKVVLVEFMGAGCTVCLRALPHHFALHDRLADNDSFEFIAMDVWTNEDEADLRDYRDRHDIPWPMAMAPRETAEAYGVRGTPTQFFIDHEGNLHSKGGYVEAPSLIGEAEFLIEQARA